MQNKILTTITDYVWQLAKEAAPRELRKAEAMYRKAQRCQVLATREDHLGLAIELASMMGANVAVAVRAKSVLDAIKTGDTVTILRAAARLHPVGALLVRAFDWLCKMFDSDPAAAQLSSHFQKADEIERTQRANMTIPDPRVSFLRGKCGVAGKFTADGPIEWAPDAAMWPFYHMGLPYLKDKPDDQTWQHDLNIYGMVQPSEFRLRATLNRMVEEARQPGGWSGSTDRITDSEVGAPLPPDWYLAEEAYIASVSQADWIDVDKYPPSLRPLPIHPRGSVPPPFPAHQSVEHYTFTFQHSDNPAPFTFQHSPNPAPPANTLTWAANLNIQ